MPDQTPAQLADVAGVYAPYGRGETLDTCTRLLTLDGDGEDTVVRLIADTVSLYARLNSVTDAALIARAALRLRVGHDAVAREFYGWTVSPASTIDPGSEALYPGEQPRPVRELIDGLTDFWLYRAPGVVHAALMGVR